jgi:hypothetical protein
VYARELLKNVLAEIAKTNESQKKEFPEIVSVEIARNVDGAGYMFYKEALIVTFDENVWMLSIGVVSGDYQAGLYDSDIIAIKILSAIVKIADINEMEVIIKIMEENNYFGNSLIIARNSGKLYVGKNRFCKNAQEVLGGVWPEFMTREPEFDYENIDVSTLGYPVIEQAHYDPNFVKVLSEKLLEILKIS